ncbi:MAG TPA: class I SAM-dependent methyltransferase [Caulobacterales bacterium]|nr:class I SAM-dependent methyltransferase [Caulobacterales bacterium]
MPIRLEPKVRAVLDRLHAHSDAQGAEIGAYFSRRGQAGELDWKGLDADAHRFLADKLVAFDRDKSEFCHQLCRALGARRVVEIGTSYGVSTLYLASAVKANGAGVVIATEYEPAKAKAARANFTAAGLADMIDLREGDLRETLKRLDGPIDFVLMDIWTEMARPAIELVGPHMRSGAIVIADNVSQFPEAYEDYFAYIDDPANKFSTLTVPFEGGLGMSVRTA